jgi:ribosomal subunit interface protein
VEKPLQISFRGMETSDAVDADIRKKIAWLHGFYDRIIGAHVTIEAPHQHSTKGNLFHVTIELSVPNGTIVVGKEHHDKQAHEDVYVAMRDAFDAALRQLQKHAEKMRDVRG